MPSLYRDSRGLHREASLFALRSDRAREREKERKRERANERERAKDTDKVQEVNAERGASSGERPNWQPVPIGCLNRLPGRQPIVLECRGCSAHVLSRKASEVDWRYGGGRTTQKGGQLLWGN